MQSKRQQDTILCYQVDYTAFAPFYDNMQQESNCMDDPSAITLLLDGATNCIMIQTARFHINIPAEI